ncbi:MAG: GAF domain-containing protein [Anaerolineae bacterium]|nr:GAF domain-containing protein [Anaerolineae bacterium]
MTRETRHHISIAAAVVVLVVLIGLTALAPPGAIPLLPGLLFGGLLVLTMTFGVLLVEGEVSLLPMTSVAACLVMGPLATGWAAFAAVIAHGLIRYIWGGRLGLAPRPEGKELVGLTAANATMHTVSILAGGLVFRAVGGGTPLLAVGWPQILPLVLLSLVYLGVNYLIAALYIATRRWTAFQSYLRSLPNLVFYEGTPLLFAPLAALIYTRLGVGAFFLFALILVAASLITHSLAFTSRRLGRRVKELDSLRAVGQTLSASLDVETILQAIYDQAATLMPAHNFYVALYDPETDEVSFPLAVENSERVQWRSRRAGNGLTEYVLRTRAPLLIRKQVEAAVKALGLGHIGRPAACWLGVPLLAGLEPLGIIAVQSFAAPEAYDASHQEVLATIAAQAAVAIQNARLYARTDEALARRVQELGSILSTTHEGMLLLDLDWRVLAANRALADLVGVAQGELVGKALRLRPGQGEPLAALIGYTLAELQADCEALAHGEEWTRKQIVVPGPPERHVERTLTPVRDREGVISGWLVALRDVTEEIQLAHLKEDMTRMLIHDLRSPLSIIKGSLDMLAITHGEGNRESFDKLLAMAQRGSDQLLRLVNNLLDISRLEEGQQPLVPEPAAARALLEEAAARFAPLLASAQIAVEIAAEPGLPLLYIDRHLIDRVLNNLLHNAIKFTPDGGRIRLWARPIDSADRPDPAPAAMLVGVSDTGPGIPLAEQPRLFQKFHRLDSTQGRWTGSGLGLSFCKLAVEEHGGRIWVESEAGQGSSFVMTLPVRP